jgi:hypothetical protein
MSIPMPLFDVMNGSLGEAKILRTGSLASALITSGCNDLWLALYEPPGVHANPVATASSAYFSLGSKTTGKACRVDCLGTSQRAEIDRLLPTPRRA